MVRKVLFVATVESHILRFHIPYLEYFKKKGYEVHVACLGDSPISFCDVFYRIPFKRFPFAPQNIRAYRVLKKIISSNHFEMIHCHTPVGGVLGRLAAIDARRENTRVLYTAHGFHFYRNAPWLYWLFFYPVEKLLSYVTDTLITMNDEDYNLASEKFHPKTLYRIRSVGVDLKRFEPALSGREHAALRKKEGVEPGDFVLMYVADLHPRKNQGFLIDAVAKLRETIPEIRLLLVGPDTNHGLYQKQVSEKKLEGTVIFTGERKDIPELIQLADIMVTSSRQEGIAINVVESLASGKFVVASDVRGNRDVIENGATGLLFPLGDERRFIEIISGLYENNEIWRNSSAKAKEAARFYDLGHALKEMEVIYENSCADNLKRL